MKDLNPFKKQYAVYLKDNTNTPHTPVYFDSLDEAIWYVDFIAPKESMVLHIKQQKELVES
jgi:hypothetical protein